MARMRTKSGSSRGIDTNRSDVYGRITDKIVAQLEEGVRPWIEHLVVSANSAMAFAAAPTHLPRSKVGPLIRRRVAACRRLLP
ncbi:hypothetical protein GGQ76_004153 [Aureimonas jatrophae]|jgi:hypothetical protein|uniref:Uncharacterized protein n=1 Tax=Aureimonas jatrophae TaxID=1166073 RepID=A0A1H0EHP3_9HYPH|nr:hypothetical protein [Aureimonas jatrophae]SDN81840.1 hypothetical protein SAMN05192530_10242 [Aureimonas jatrophae]